MKNKVKYASRHKGFTLLELMIVIVVIGILAAIAIPSYTQYIQRSHRSNARNALIQTAQWMERAATASGTYPTGAAIVFPVVEGGRYTVALSADAALSSATTYSLTATPTGGQVTDPCGSLLLNQANNRSTRNSANTGVRAAADIALQSDEACWQR